MLKIVRKMEELDTWQLLDIYGLHPPDAEAFLSYLREDFFRQSGAFYAIWVEDNLYRSAVRLEPYRDGMLLHALETAPNVRRRGYGYCLLMDTLVLLRTFNCKVVFSHVDKQNRPSLNLHVKCGFEMIKDSAVLLDGTVTQNHCTLCYRL